MISPSARNFLNSTFVNVKSLRDIEGEPILKMHAVDAEARNLASGSVVRVFNQRGDYRCTLQVSSRARPGRRQRHGHLVAQAGHGRQEREPAHQPEANGYRAGADLLRLSGGGRGGIGSRALLLDRFIAAGAHY